MGITNDPIFNLLTLGAMSRLSLFGTGTQQSMAQVQINRTAGNAFRDQIASILQASGRQVETEVFKRTPFGARFIDIEVSSGGRVLGGIETKVGNSQYGVAQRAKDYYLKKVKNYPVDVIRKP